MFGVILGVAQWCAVLLAAWLRFDWLDLVSAVSTMVLAAFVLKFLLDRDEELKK